MGLFGSIITLIGVLGSIVGIYEFSRKIIPPFINSKYSSKRVHAILETFVSQLVEIDRGTFLMGSDKLYLKEENSLPDEYPKHQVAITHKLWVSKFPVTQELWEAVMGTKYRGRYKKYFGLTKPIVNVSWVESVRFCNSLSRLLNRTPAYKLTDPDSADPEVIFNINSDGFRLPTEAEWEYFCRGGTKTLYWCGDSYSELLKHEWTGDNTGNLMKVGKKKENPWGLMDMNGLVGEWCFDKYDKHYYEHSPSTNPLGPETGSTRVWRSGTYKWGRLGNGDSHPDYYRCADRDQGIPTNYNEYVGFRVVATKLS